MKYTNKGSLPFQYLGNCKLYVGFSRKLYQIPIKSSFREIMKATKHVNFHTLGVEALWRTEHNKIWLKSC